MLSEQLQRGDFGLRFAADGQVTAAWYDFSEMSHETRRSVMHRAMLNITPLSAHIDFNDRTTLHVVEPEDFAFARFFESQRNYLQSIAAKAAGIYFTLFSEELVVLRSPDEIIAEKVVNGLKSKPYGRIIVASPDQHGEMQKATYSPFAHVQTGMNLSGIQEAMSGQGKIIIARAV